MKFIRNILTTLLLAFCCSMQADNLAYLSIVQTDGQTNFNINTIRRITFSDGYMVFALTDNTEQKLPLSSLSRMFFSADGVDAIKTVESQKPAFALQEGVLSVEAQEGTQVTIYDMNGRPVRNTTAQKAGTSINLNGMSKGVYIVRVGKDIKKIMNK